VYGQRLGLKVRDKDWSFHATHAIEQPPRFHVENRKTSVTEIAKNVHSFLFYGLTFLHSIIEWESEQYTNYILQIWRLRCKTV
jgi:hypothetical protein